MSLKIIQPSIAYAQSYADALREGLHYHPASEDKIKAIETDFDGWVKADQDENNPVIAADGRVFPRVPSTRLWLVNEKRLLGEASVRHYLTDALHREGGHIGYGVRKSERRKGYGTLLLEAALKITKDLGIEDVLITCDDTNLGSCSLIENANGILENKISMPDRETLLRRYWIKLQL